MFGYTNKYNTSASWKFINILPIDVELYIRKYSGMIFKVGDLNARDSLIIQNKNMIYEGDELHVLYKTDGSKRDFIEPFYLFSHTNIVNIGDVLTESKAQTATQRSHSDIMGIRFHNMISVPVDVYHRNMKLATIANRNSEHNSIFATNERFGFNVGDELSFSLHIGDKILPYCTVKIDDDRISDIYIGKINQNFEPSMKEQVIYRFG